MSTEAKHLCLRSHPDLAALKQLDLERPSFLSRAEGLRLSRRLVGDGASERRVGCCLKSTESRIRQQNALRACRRGFCGEKKCASRNETNFGTVRLRNVRNCTPCQQQWSSGEARGGADGRQAVSGCASPLQHRKNVRSPLLQR